MSRDSLPYRQLRKCLDFFFDNLVGSLPYRQLRNGALPPAVLRSGLTAVQEAQLNLPLLNIYFAYSKLNIIKPTLSIFYNK